MAASDEVRPEAPWLGLRPFEEAHHDYFFGRRRELADLFRRVTARSLTVLYGRSGLGKTSLLHAGLVVKLRDVGVVPIVLRIQHTNDAAAADAQLLHALCAQAGLDVDTLRRKLPEDLRDSTSALAWLLLHDPQHRVCTLPATRWVVVIDQFEEVFTIGQQPERRAGSRAYLELLGDLVENRMPESLREHLASEEGCELAARIQVAARPCHWLIALREDYLTLLERLRTQMPSMMDNRVELRELDGVQALEAITGPASLRTFVQPSLPALVDDDTARAIVRFVAKAPDDRPLEQIEAVPPLLSLLCAELNTKRGQAPTIERELLRGQADNILADFYQRSLSDQPAAARAFVEDRLISPGGFRQSANLDAFVACLQEYGIADADARKCLEHLVQDRLLVSEERGDIRRIELTHDILVPLVVRSRKQREEAERVQAEQAAMEANRRQAERELSAATATARLERKRLRVAVTFSVLCVALLIYAAVAQWMALDASERAETMLWNSAGAHVRTARDQATPAMALAYVAKALDCRQDVPGAATLGVGIAAASNRQLTTLLLHANAVRKARFSADGRRVLTASDDGSARIWDAETGAEVVPGLKNPRALADAIFSPDEKLVITFAENAIVVWEASSGRQVKSFTNSRLTGRRLRTWLSHDLSTLIGVDDVGAAYTWSLADERKRERAAGDALAVGALVGNDTTQLMFVQRALPSVRLVDVETGAEQRLFPLRDAEPVVCAAMSQDGGRLVVGSERGALELWDAAKGERRHRLSASFLWPPLGILREPGMWTGEHRPRGSRPAWISFSPDSQHLLFGYDDGSTDLASFGSGRVRTLQAKNVRFTPDSQEVVVLREGTALVFDAVTQEPRGTIEAPSTMNDAFFSRDSRHMATTSPDNVVRVWDLSSGELLSSLRGHEGPVTNVEFSPDGKRLLTSSEDHTARVWALDVAPFSHVLDGHSAPVTQAVLSPDARHALTASKREVRRYDLLTGAHETLLQGFEDERVQLLSNQPGTRFVTLVDGEAVLWRAGSGSNASERIASLSDAGAKVDAVTFDVAGEQVATTSPAGGTIVWRAEDGARVAPLDSPLRNCDAMLAFSPAGHVLASSCHQSAEIWAVQARRYVEIRGFDDRLLSGVFDAESKRLFTAGSDDTVRIWDIRSGAELAKLVGKAPAQHSSMFNDHGTRVITIQGDNSAWVWDTQARGAIAVLRDNGDPLQNALLSHDGTLALTSASGLAQVWRVETGASAAVLRSPESAFKVADISRDGQRVLSGHQNGVARLWSILPDTAPAWFNDFLRLVGTKKLEASGDARRIAGREFYALRQAALAAARKDRSEFGAFARAYFGVHKPALAAR